MKPQLTIEAFADWCEKQPADKRYPYMSTQICACACYAAFLGLDFRDIDITGGFWGDIDDIASEKPHTFGAIASRLRAIPSPADERRQP